ncbi:HD domain-containing protein [bacterium]|nr:HD domain-containing protein [bacterium]
MPEEANLERVFRPFISWLIPGLGVLVFVFSLQLLLEEHGETIAGYLGGDRSNFPWETLHLLLIPILAGVLTTLLVVSVVKEGELRRSRQRMKSLLDHTGDAIVVTNPSWEIRYMNKAAESLFEVLLEGVMGEVIEELFDEGASRWFRRVGVREEITRALVEGKTEGGKRLELEATLSAFPLADGTFHSLILRDLTERKALEEREILQARILRQLNASVKVDELARGFLDILTETLEGIKGAALFLCEKEEMRLVRKEGKLSTEIMELPPVEEALVVTGEEVKEIALGLWTGKEPVGLLRIAQEGDFYNPSTEAFLRLLALPLGTAVDRTRSVRSAEGRGKRLGRATAFAEALSQFNSQEALFRAALGHLAEEFQFREGWVYLWEEKMEPSVSWSEEKNGIGAPTIDVLSGGGLFMDEKEGEPLVARPMVSEGNLLGALVFLEPSGGLGEEEGGLLPSFVAQLSVALANLKKREKLERSFVATLNVISELLEMRDAYTEGHSERLAVWADKVGDRLGMGNRERRDLRIASRIHDIGKIGISDEILLKPGPLSKVEFEKMKEHPDLGVKALHHLSELKEIVEMVAHHHERFDGRGYPQGLKGEEIPLGARIISVVDTFDAITTDRPYRKKRTEEEAIGILQENGGSQFDPQVVTVFCGVLSEEG